MMSRLLAGVARAILAPVRDLALKLAMRTAPQITSHGVAILDLTTSGEAQALFPQVAAALQYIHEYEPRRLARMVGDVRRVLIVKTRGAAGEFWPHLSAIVLDTEHVRHQTTQSVALTLVHEAVHARLWKNNIRRGYDEARVELICLWEEIAFAQRLPHSERLISGVHAKMTSGWWSGPRRTWQAARRLRDLGIPRPVRRILIRLQARDRDFDTPVVRDVQTPENLKPPRGHKMV